MSKKDKEHIPKYPTIAEQIDALDNTKTYFKQLEQVIMQSEAINGLPKGSPNTETMLSMIEVIKDSMKTIDSNIQRNTGIGKTQEFEKLANIEQTHKNAGLEVNDLKTKEDYEKLNNAIIKTYNQSQTLIKSPGTAKIMAKEEQRVGNMPKSVEINASKIKAPNIPKQVTEKQNAQITALVACKDYIAELSREIESTVFQKRPEKNAEELQQLVRKDIPQILERVMDNIDQLQNRISKGDNIGETKEFKALVNLEATHQAQKLDVKNPQSYATYQELEKSLTNLEKESKALIEMPSQKKLTKSQKVKLGINKKIAKLKNNTKNKEKASLEIVNNESKQQTQSTVKATKDNKLNAEAVENVRKIFSQSMSDISALASHFEGHQISRIKLSYNKIDRIIEQTKVNAAKDINPQSLEKINKIAITFSINYEQLSKELYNNVQDVSDTAIINKKIQDFCVNFNKILTTTADNIGLVEEPKVNKSFKLDSSDIELSQKDLLKVELENAKNKISEAGAILKTAAKLALNKSTLKNIVKHTVKAFVETDEGLYRGAKQGAEQGAKISDKIKKTLIKSEPTLEENIQIFEKLINKQLKKEGKTGVYKSANYDKMSPIEKLSELTFQSSAPLGEKFAKTKLSPEIQAEEVKALWKIDNHKLSNLQNEIINQIRGKDFEININKDIAKLAQAVNKQLGGKLNVDLPDNASPMQQLQALKAESQAEYNLGISSKQQAKGDDPLWKHVQPDIAHMSKKIEKKILINDTKVKRETLETNLAKLEENPDVKRDGEYQNAKTYEKRIDIARKIITDKSKITASYSPENELFKQLDSNLKSFKEAEKLSNFPEGLDKTAIKVAAGIAKTGAVGVGAGLGGTKEFIKSTFTSLKDAGSIIMEKHRENAPKQGEKWNQSRANVAAIVRDLKAAKAMRKFKSAQEPTNKIRVPSKRDSGPAI